MTCLKQIFLGATQFGGNCPQMPPVATGLNQMTPTRVSVITSYRYCRLLQVFKGAAKLIKNFKMEN